MSEKNTPPAVTVLGPITPTVESVRSEYLDYEKLGPAAEKHRPYEYARLHAFFDTEDESLEEEKAARNQALQYLLFTANALLTTVTSESRSTWSERYTKATSELYGVPDVDRARTLYDMAGSGEIMEYPFSETASRIGDYLDNKYKAVYEALGLDDAPEYIDAEGIAERFEAGIAVLGNEDEAWLEWTVDRPDTDKLMVSKNTVQVGLHRASVTPTQLKALFTHEVLVHAARAVNGAKQPDQRLKTGLPGYLEAEEGVGIFAEYAISGEMKDVVVDRYVDIAYALGLIDGKEHTRQELIEMAMSRAGHRSMASSDGKSHEDIAKDVYAHVNRIYRGSRGDDYVGIFTKDIAYYNGFLKIGEYLEERLSAGASLEEAWGYIMSGKFDPTDERHTIHVVSSGL